VINDANTSAIHFYEKTRFEKVVMAATS